MDRDEFDKIEKIEKRLGYRREPRCASCEEDLLG